VSACRNGRIPGKKNAVLSGNFVGIFAGGLHSLFILEKGKPVVRPGRKAVDHDRHTEAAWLPGYRKDDCLSRASKPESVAFTGSGNLRRA
jgi:hypothetical protein